MAFSEERYYERKLAGLCVQCGAAALEDSVFCDRHREVSRRYARSERRRALSKRPSRRRKSMWYWRRRRKALVRRGLCGNCGREPLATRVLGERCRERALANYFKRTTKQRSHAKCTACNGAGHRYTTCKKRFMTPSEAAGYATARNEVFYG